MICAPCVRGDHAQCRECGCQHRVPEKTPGGKQEVTQGSGKIDTPSSDPLTYRTRVGTGKISASPSDLFAPDPLNVACPSCASGRGEECLDRAGQPIMAHRSREAKISPPPVETTPPEPLSVRCPYCRSAPGTECVWVTYDGYVGQPLGGTHHQRVELAKVVGEAQAMKDYSATPEAHRAAEADPTALLDPDGPLYWRCRTCDAEPGEPCLASSGNAFPSTVTHYGRTPIRPVCNCPPDSGEQESISYSCQVHGRPTVCSCRGLPEPEFDRACPIHGQCTATHRGRRCVRGVGHGGLHFRDPSTAWRAGYGDPSNIDQIPVSLPERPHLQEIERDMAERGLFAFEPVKQACGKVDDASGRNCDEPAGHLGDHRQSWPCR